VQTADTGQIVPASASLPAVNTDSGYLIYRFNDAQQSTDPIFLKFGLGRANAAHSTRITIQVGQGTNGAGTLTGTTSPVVIMGGDYASPAADYVTTDYATHSAGFFGFVFAALPSGAAYQPQHVMTLQRTRDQVSLNFDGLGFVMIYPRTYNTESVMTSVTWASGEQHFTLDYSHHFCMPVAGVSLTDSNQAIAWPHFYNVNNVVKQAWATWTTNVSNMTTGANTFVASPYGVARTWISIGASSRGICGVGLSEDANVWLMNFVWE
jgi:hypothetical protein